MEQLWMSIDVAEGEDKVEKSSPLWKRAIGALACDKRLKQASTFVTLPIPEHVEDGWREVIDGVPYRCITQWVPFPTDGMPPGFRSRVDVAFETANQDPAAGGHDARP